MTPKITTIPRSNPDSIQNLQLSTSLKSKLINNGYTSISKISKTISDGNSFGIKNISGIGSASYIKIVNAVNKHNTKNNIDPVGDIIRELEKADNEEMKKNEPLPIVTKYDLGDILVKFVTNLITDENVVKLQIRTPDFEYPNDNILYDQNNNVFFKVEYLTNEFEKYVYDNYEVHIRYSNKSSNLLKIAVSNLNNTGIIYHNERFDLTTRNVIKYNFNTFKFINSKTLYVEFLMDKLIAYTNTDIKINVCDDIFDKLVLQQSDSIDTYEFKNTILDNDFKDLPEKTINELKDIIYSNKTDKVYVSSCKNIFQNSYIAVFDVVQRTSDDQFNFDTNHIVGTYQFNMDDKYNGEILISKSFNGNLDYIKDSIIKELFS